MVCGVWCYDWAIGLKRKSNSGGGGLKAGNGDQRGRETKRERDWAAEKLRGNGMGGWGLRQ